MIQSYEASIDPLIKADAINTQVHGEKLRELQGNLGHRINYDKNPKFMVNCEITKVD